MPEDGTGGSRTRSIDFFRMPFRIGDLSELPLYPLIEGMKLNRFDRPLGLNRERIDLLYRGCPAVAVGQG
jgi:hypothetical protein